MFTLDIRADFSKQIAMLNNLKKGLGDQVIVPSLNATIAQTQTKMIAGITETYNIKAADVRAKMSQTRAKRTGQQFEATLYGNPYGRSRRALNIGRFLVGMTKRQQKRAAKAAKAFGGRIEPTFQVLKAGSPHTIEKAFILNVPGHPAFHRVDGKMKPLYTIGVPQMFMAHKVQDPVQAWIPGKFAEIFESKARYFMSTIK